MFIFYLFFCREKLVPTVTNLLKETQVSKELKNNGRLCTPRLLFICQQVRTTTLGRKLFILWGLYIPCTTLCLSCHSLSSKILMLRNLKCALHCITRWDFDSQNSATNIIAKMTSGQNFMALLTVSKHSVPMGAGNSTRMSSVFHRLAGNFCFCAC